MLSLWEIAFSESKLENHLFRFGKKIFFQFWTSKFSRFTLCVLKSCRKLFKLKMETSLLCCVYGNSESETENLLSSSENASHSYPLWLLQFSRNGHRTLEAVKWLAILSMPPEAIFIMFNLLFRNCEDTWQCTVMSMGMKNPLLGCWFSKITCCFLKFRTNLRKWFQGATEVTFDTVFYALVSIWKHMSFLIILQRWSRSRDILVYTQEPSPVVSISCHISLSQNTSLTVVWQRTSIGLAFAELTQDGGPTIMHINYGEWPGLQYAIILPFCYVTQICAK